MSRFDLAQVPTTVKLHGADLPVVAAVFVPGDLGVLDSHVVVYDNGRAPLVVEQRFNVHYLVHDDDAGASHLHQGSYDLAYREALAELNRRVAGERI